MDTNFYIVLPSDSSLTRYPENYGGKYVVELNQSIRVNSHYYEVGLSEIVFTQDWNPLIPHDIWVKIFINQKEGGIWKEVIFKSLNLEDVNQYFSNPKDFVDKVVKPLFTNSLKEGAIQIEDGYFNLDEKNIFSWRAILRHEDQRPVRLQMSSALQNILGYGARQLKEGFYFQTNEEFKITENKSQYPVNVDRGITSLWVYTDIIEPYIVGHGVSPLLRIVPVSPGDHTSVSRVVKFERPYYFPLNADNISKIEISIYNIGGLMPIEFSSPVVCTLHFRRKKFSQ